MGCSLPGRNLLFSAKLFLSSTQSSLYPQRLAERRSGVQQQTMCRLLCFCWANNALCSEKHPFSTGVKVQCVSKEWCGPRYFIARIRIPQLQLPAQSQDGILRNSNILIFIFQVNGIYLHQKSGIQLRTEPANPHLTQESYKNLEREVVCCCFWFLVGFFFLNAIISVEDLDLRVNGENRTKHRIIKTKVNSIFSSYLSPSFWYSSVRWLILVPKRASDLRAFFPKYTLRFPIF